MHFDLRHLLPVVLLLGLLCGAVATDVRNRRIPNALVLAGILLGLGLNASVTSGAGLFSLPFGGVGLLSALGGMLLGLFMLLPIYLLNAMGAGDVKLMAMVGAFLGVTEIIGATLASLLAGGVLALTVAGANGSLGRVLSNVKTILLGAALSSIAGASARMAAPMAPTGKLPYAIAIAVGTVSYLVATRLDALQLQLAA